MKVTPDLKKFFPQKEDKYFTPGQAASFLNCTRQHIHYLIHRGKLLIAGRVGRYYLLSADEIVAMKGNLKIKDKKRSGNRGYKN